MLRPLLGELIERVVPGLALSRLEGRARRAALGHESELRALAALSDQSHRFLDVGANEGLYTAHLRSRVHSTHLFEPVPQMADHLKRLFPSSEVKVVGLSDSPGSAVLRIPVINGQLLTTRSSIHLEGQAEHEQEITIKLEKLDDVAPSGRLLVKIDVEGHEIAVVRGGSSVLSDRADAVLVESEERHASGAPSKLIEWFSDHEFGGWIVLGDHLIDVGAYDPNLHQMPEHGEAIDAGDGRPPGYGNNFLFVRKELLTHASSMLKENKFSIG